MRLRYFGQREGKSRTAVLEWEESEMQAARKIIGTLSGNWKMKVHGLVAYVELESRADFNELMKEYKVLKEALRNGLVVLKRN